MARQFSLVHQLPPIQLLTPATDAAGRTSSYRSLKNMLKAFIVFHVAQGNAATIALTPVQATVVAGTDSKVLTNATRIWSNLAVGTNDTYVARTAAANYTTDAGVAHKIVIFEIVPEACMDVAGGFDCIALTTGASDVANVTSAMLYGVLAYAGDSRPNSYLD